MIAITDHSDRDKVEKYSFKTSLNAYNEHCTNIVAVKQRIHLNKTKMDPDDYKVVVDLLNKIYHTDHAIYKAIGEQDVRRRKVRQTRAKKCLNQ